MLHKFFKLFIPAVLCLLSAFAASAQDRIYLKNGSIIQAKVKEISAKNITYKQWDNQDGADYVLNRREVDHIIYQNGREEKFSGRTEHHEDEDARNDESEDRKPAERETLNKHGKTAKNSKYGKNILAFAPMQMTDQSVAGVGVHYERFLDDKGVFSFYLPIAVSFFDDNVNSYVSGVSITKNASRIFTYAYPGVKIYPAGSHRRVTYSIGPSLGFGFGTLYKPSNSYDTSSGITTTTYKEGSVFKMGFMLNNGLNIQATPKFYLGLEFGMGIFYYDNADPNYTIGNSPMVQFNFKMGYRF